jgi:rod shape-determining protein MreD
LEKVSRGSTLKITVCLFAAAYLQTTLAQQAPASLGRWLGHVSWLLLVVVYIALQRDPVKSLMTAAAAGAIHDALSMGSGVGVKSGVGVNGLAMVIAAYVADRIASVIMVDNLIFRFLAVTAGSLINTLVRLAFYGLLKLELPALASGREIAAAIVFDLIANLFASVLLYIALDRVFNKGFDQRRRRLEARRLRPRL